MKQNRQLKYSSVNHTNNTELKLFKLNHLIHFDDCIQCDLTIKELI